MSKSNYKSWIIFTHASSSTKRHTQLGNNKNTPRAPPLIFFFPEAQRMKGPSRTHIIYEARTRKLNSQTSTPQSAFGRSISARMCCKIVNENRQKQNFQHETELLPGTPFGNGLRSESRQDGKIATFHCCASPRTRTNELLAFHNYSRFHVSRHLKCCTTRNHPTAGLRQYRPPLVCKEI